MIKLITNSGNPGNRISYIVLIHCVRNTRHGSGCVFTKYGDVMHKYDIFCIELWLYDYFG